MLATVTYMGFGIPFIYMGQEVGLTNCQFDSMDELKKADIQRLKEIKGISERDAEAVYTFFHGGEES